MFKITPLKIFCQNFILLFQKISKTAIRFRLLSFNTYFSKISKEN